MHAARPVGPHTLFYLWERIRSNKCQRRSRDWWEIFKVPTRSWLLVIGHAPAVMSCESTDMDGRCTIYWHHVFVIV